MCSEGGRSSQSQGRTEANDGEIRVSHCQIDARETEVEVEDEEKAFGLTGVVLSEWCLWTKQEDQRAKAGVESFLVKRFLR